MHGDFEHILWEYIHLDINTSDSLLDTLKTNLTMSDQVLIWETRLFCMILCHVLQSVLCFKGINFVITDDGVPPSLGTPQHLQIQQVSSLLECARSCAVNTPCDQFQFSDTTSTCIRRYTLVVNGGLVENVTGLFVVYSRNPKGEVVCFNNALLVYPFHYFIIL